MQQYFDQKLWSGPRPPKPNPPIRFLVCTTKNFFYVALKYVCYILFDACTCTALIYLSIFFHYLGKHSNSAPGQFISELGKGFLFVQFRKMPWILDSNRGAIKNFTIKGVCLDSFDKTQVLRGSDMRCANCLDGRTKQYVGVAASC